MEILSTLLFLIAISLISVHIYAAYKFERAMKGDAAGKWSSLGSPHPLMFWWGDLKRFKRQNQSLIAESVAISRAYRLYKNSWAFGFPILLLVVLVNEFA